MTRIGIVGTGFIARAALRRITANPGMEVSRILTRRPIESVEELPAELLTRSTAQFIDDCDVVLEVSGDAVHGTDVLLHAVAADRTIVTMNSELQVTTGSHFARVARYFTEADGDQPGATARLRLDVESAGFEALAYVNIKGFLNLDPSLEDMRFWAQRQGLALDQVVSFTDGTKLQIEQAFVANGLGADIVRDGMIGKQVRELRDTDFLVDAARVAGGPISDFVLCPSAPPGVFLLARSEHADALGDYGPTAKLRTAGGQAYLMLRPHHLCPLEIPRTLIEIERGAPPLLNNSTSPRIGVAAVVKGPLRAGKVVPRAIGSFEFRGMAVRIVEHPQHVPLCLLADARLKRDMAAGEIVQFDDVELPPGAALSLYLSLRDDAVTSSSAIRRSRTPGDDFGLKPRDVSRE